MENSEQLRERLVPILGDFLCDKRWFGGKARRIERILIEDIVPIERPGFLVLFVLARIEYREGSDETYAVPLLAGRAKPGSVDSLEKPGQIEMHLPLRDALQHEDVLGSLYEAIERKSTFRGLHGDIHAFQTGAFDEVSLTTDDISKPKVITSEQSNSSSIFGNRAILKIFRRVHEGVNPELEVGRFLTERAHFKNSPALGGWLEYRSHAGKTMTLGVLQRFVPNAGDAWQLTLKSFGGLWRNGPGFFQQISGQPSSVGSRQLYQEEAPAIARELFGESIDAMALLGQRTAEMHKALASDNSDVAFQPEAYTPKFQQQTEDSLRASVSEVLKLLNSQLAHLSADVREQAETVLRKRDDIMSAIHQLLARPLSGSRIRIHGDYHLGQVLRSESDFVIIDFEGEPGRRVADRAVKRSALQDVAGMLRSLQYVAVAPLLMPIHGIETPQGDYSQLLQLAEYWSYWVSNGFLKSYFETAGSADFIPKDIQELSSLLRLNLMAKALFELSYELNNRPEWVRIPLLGILKLIEHPIMPLPVATKSDRVRNS